MSLMTRFLGRRSAQAARSAGDLAGTIGGAPTPQVINAAANGRRLPAPADEVTSELVVKDPTLKLPTSLQDARRTTVIIPRHPRSDGPQT
jgi:hypothetical protein